MPQSDGHLGEVLEAIIARRRSNSTLRTLSNVPDECIDFSSNDYLSLSENLEIQRSFLARLEARIAQAGNNKSRASILGSGGSRLLDGNTSFAESLEAKIAAFHGAEAGLLFNSAFDANIGLLSCVPQPGDSIIYDELIHASVHDGMRLSRAAKKIPFAHESILEGARRQDTGASIREPGVKGRRKGLDEVLKRLLAGEGGHDVRAGRTNVFICAEGIYSVDGDVVSIPTIVETVKRNLPLGNGYIIIDEAHSVGIFGENGRGLVCELGLEDQIWVRVLGFGKAVNSAGGIVLCSSTTRTYLINYARSLIYTTSMPFASLTSIDVVYDSLISGRCEPLRRQLNELIQDTRGQLEGLCARRQPPADILRIGRIASRSPIIPVFTAYPRSLATHCQQSGFMVRPIVSPTVPTGSERVRICLHAGNTTAQVEGLCAAIGVWIQRRMEMGEDQEGGRSKEEMDCAGGVTQRSKAQL